MKKLLGGVLLSAVVLAGCSGPTVEGSSWTVDLSQLDGAEDEELVEYITPVITFEDDVASMKVEIGDVTGAPMEVQMGVTFLQGMIGNLDLSTYYTEEDNFLTIDPLEEGDLPLEYDMEWDGSDTVTLTPLDDTDIESLVLIKYEGDENNE